MSWSNTTLATTASLSEIENEVNKLIESSGTEYSFNGESIATSIVQKGDALDVTGGMIEIIGKAATQLTIEDTKTLSFTVHQSTTESGSYAAIYDGFTLYSKTASGSTTIAADTILFRWVVPTNINDYIKFNFESNEENSGTISVYSISRWADKITFAKNKIRNRLEAWLVDFGYKDYVDYDNGEMLIDLIANPSIFELSCNLLALHYIYRDLAIGKGEDHIWYMKSRDYKQDYEEEFEDAVRRINLDTDLDNDTDEYKKDWESKLIL